MHGTSQCPPPRWVGRSPLSSRAHHDGTGREELIRENGTVPEFEDAAKNANEVVESKSISIGYGLSQASVFFGEPPSPPAEQASETAEEAAER